MAGFFQRNRLSLLTIVYWFMLSYILAALIWWFMELWRQNTHEFNYRKSSINLNDPYYANRVTALEIARKKKESQFIGEGLFFLLMTITGAVFVYRTARYQIRLNEQQRRFMATVTHELKTPIAVTRLNLETLRTRKLEGAVQEKLINNTLEENNRLNDLCNNILLTSQLDAGEYKLSMEDTDLNDLAARVTADFRQRFPERDLIYTGPDKIMIRADVLFLQLALNNVIENALKYSPKESTVTIQVGQQGEKVILRVADHGPGIPQAEKKLVFGKFYRMGEENTGATKGTGLGLYLSKRIVMDHEGELFILDNKPKGSIFVLEFPVK
jgi:hypothetical protein